MGPSLPPTSTRGLETDGRWKVERLVPASPDFHAALYLALNGAPPGTDPAADPRILELLTDVHRGSLAVNLLFGTYRHGRLVSACVAVESPGAAALVSLPTDAKSNSSLGGMVEALRTLRAAAVDRGIVLLEILLPPGSSELSRTVQAAGFRFLTGLVYLTRPSNAPGSFHEGVEDSVQELSWVEYSPETDRLFQEGIERTYAQSLDCPELTGLRSTAEVIAGHRAVGLFDPSLWFAALRQKEPVGVILLSRMSVPQTLEVVYMGVAQPARGTGVANALLRRAVDAGDRLDATTLALAVDQRNAPALRLYDKWGFARTGFRDAWIATFVHSGG